MHRGLIMLLDYKSLIDINDVLIEKQTVSTLKHGSDQLFIKYERVHIIITLLSVCTFQMFLLRTSISLSSQTCSVKENTYISC